MFEFVTGLFDPTGFTPRAHCGAAWGPALIALHAVSDLLIWLAYVSIPLALLYFTNRRDLPYPRLFVLFALFILSCGTTHLLDALVFQYPIYRFAGLMKAVTAVVSWVTVVALIQLIPRVLPGPGGGAPGDDTTPHRPLRDKPDPRTRAYIVAVLVAVLAILVRAAVAPILEQDNVFVVSLLGVVYVSWQYGLLPGLVTLVIGVLGYTYFFLPPRNSFVIEGLGNQLAVALFFFCGVACAALGESQRVAQRRARSALGQALGRQQELESEVARRRVVEAALRQREAELTAARVQAEEALARLDAFIDNAPVGIVFFDPELRYERINAYLAAVNGKPVADHLGRTLNEVLPDFPRETAAAYRDIAAGAAPGFAGLVEATNPATGADESWQVTAFPVRRPDGHNLGAGVVLYDITERRKAERDLADREAQFRTLAQAVPHIVWVTRPDGYHEYFNHRWYAYTGLTEEQSLGFDWSRPLHPDDKARAEARWRESTETGREYEIEYRFRRHDGQYRWFLGRALPQLDAEGRVVRWYGTCTDIHDERLATEAVRRNEERYRTLTEAVPNIVWNADPGGEVSYFNRRWAEFTGVTPGSARGDTWLACVHPDDRDRVRAAWRGGAGAAGRFAAEFRLRAADGSYRWFQSVAAALRLPDGRIDQWIGTMSDVHDQKTAVETIRGLNEQIRYQVGELQTILDAAPAAIWISRDRECAVITGNQTAADLLRADPARNVSATKPDPSPRGFREFGPDGKPIPPDRLPMQVAARDGVPVLGAELVMLFDDGHVRHILGNAVPLTGPDGEHRGAVSVFVDVTDLKRAEARLQESEELFRQLAESVPQLAWMTESDGSIFWYNQRWYEYTGTTFEEMRGWGWQAVHDPRELARILPRWKAHLASGEPWEDTFPLRRADGQFRWFLSRARPLRNPVGEIIRWIGTNTDVTEQRDLEHTLRASEARFRTLTETVPLVVWTADPGGAVTYFNRRWAEYAGRTGTGHWVGAVHPDDRDRVGEAWAEALGTGEPFADEFRLRGADGADRWFLAAAVPLRDPDGRVEQWIGALADIHEQKSAAASIEEANQFLEATINAMSSHLAVLDPEGGILKVNEAWRRFGAQNGLDMSGYGLGANYLDICDRACPPGEEGHSFGAEIRAVIRGDRAGYVTEYPCHSPTERRWFLMRVNRFPGAGPVRVVVSHEDISARVAAEQGLRASEARFRTLTEALPQIVWTADPVGGITFVNRRWGEFAGPGRGGDWIAAVHPDDRGAAGAAWLDAQGRADQFGAEFRLRRADGAYRWFLSAAVPLRNPGGVIHEWVGTLTDIDDQKRQTELLERLVRERTAALEQTNAALTTEVTVRQGAEQQVRAVAAELQRSNGELEKFAYVASHDLQEPLRKIQAFGDRLATKCRDALPDTGKEYVDRMLSAAARMRRLIDDLLTFSRVTTQRSPFRTLDLTKLVGEVVSDLEVRLAQTGGKVLFGPLGVVAADPTQMRQLFQNLLVNAIKFHRPGVPPEVRIVCEPADLPPPGGDGPPVPGVAISVVDNGIGFDDKYKDRIFQVFQRLHGRDEYEGTGVGLAICRKIAERHGGTVSAHGRPGAGATFVVTLPAAHTTNCDDGSDDAQPEKADHDPDGR